MIPELYIRPSDTVRTALKKLDLNGVQAVLVVDENKCLLGTISDGDVRRLILSGIDLSETIENKYHKNPFRFHQGAFTIDDVKEAFLKLRIRLIPVLDHTNKVVELLTWEKTFSGEIVIEAPERQLEVDVVIMAGGKGTRLAPFTDVFPKPLIPVGNETILEKIIKGFRRFGIDRFYMTTNYKGEMIRAYFDSLEKDYEVICLKEKEFCGTAGSLFLVPPEISDTFIVSNCDILVRANYAEVMDFHKSSQAMLTIVSSIHHHTIPYGVVRFREGGDVTSIEEKPEYTVPINTGVYILSKACLKYIEQDKVFHMTHLIEALLANDLKVATYPVNEGDYIDIGQWDEYKSALSKIGGFV